MTTNQDNKKPQKVLATYALVALIVIFLLNIFVIPGLMERSVVETSYSDFLSALDSRQIKEVEFDTSNYTIYYTMEQDGRPMICKTGLMYISDELIDRLSASGADFGSVIPTQQSPLASLFVGLILPVILFAGVGVFLSRMMTKSMTGGPGGAMAFGKSNAKIYVKSSTGIKFSDVAGEDEAKELLTEIVDFLHNPQKYREIGASMPKGALPEPVKPCWPKRSPERRTCLSFPFPDRNSWKCSWAWARRKSATCLSRPMKRLPVSSSSTKSIPSAKRETVRSAVTTSASRP